MLLVLVLLKNLGERMLWSKVPALSCALVS